MTILIENLIFDAIIGVLDFERQKPQKIILDAEIEYNYQGEYLNYAQIVEFFIKETKQNAYFLLEDALEDLSAKLKTTYPMVTSLTLSLKKPEILSNVVVGVKITR